MAKPDTFFTRAHITVGLVGNDTLTGWYSETLQGKPQYEFIMRPAKGATTHGVYRFSTLAEAIEFYMDDK